MRPYTRSLLLGIEEDTEMPVAVEVWSRNGEEAMESFGYHKPKAEIFDSIIEHPDTIDNILIGITSVRPEVTDIYTREIILN